MSFAGGNWETCDRMEKTKRTPLNNLDLDLKREERPCTVEYLPSLGSEHARHKMELADWLVSSCGHNYVLA